MVNVSLRESEAIWLVNLLRRLGDTQPAKDILRVLDQATVQSLGPQVLADMLEAVT